MANSILSKLKDRSVQLRVLLLAAAIWHLAAAATIYEVGKHQLAPNHVYRTGIGPFASDGIIYQTEAVELCSILRSQGVVAWLTWPTQLHLRLYSLPLMIFVRWTGFNILTIEPLNGLYFLTILVLVFRLGKTLFDGPAGLLAATIVSVWPSFLLHTTQLLRDPLLIVAVLAFLLTIVEAMRRNISWQRGLWLGTISLLTLVTIRIVRLPMWTMLCAIVGLAVLLVIVRWVRSREIGKGVVIFGACLVLAIAIIPRFQPWFHNQQETRLKRTIFPEEVQKLPVEQQIFARRAGFQFRIDPDGRVFRSEDGSRIDAEIQFSSVTDVVRYIPRALVIGFLAPFPNMWFTAGKQVGASGRWLSGFETMTTYVLECFALIGLWNARRQLVTWFLAAVTVLGLVALGLVVNNIGALYRLRYPFWMLIVIFAAGGLVHLARLRFDSRRSVA